MSTAKRLATLAPEGAGFAYPTTRPASDAEIIALPGLETRGRQGSNGNGAATKSNSGTSSLKTPWVNVPLGTTLANSRQNSGTDLVVPTAISTDTTGPAAGGIDVNYTVQGNTGVNVLITLRDKPHDVVYYGSEASGTPLTINAADFIDGVGPGTGVTVDVYVRGYKTVTGDGGETATQFTPWAAIVQGTLA